MPDLIGKTLDGYRIIEQIGLGRDSHRLQGLSARDGPLRCSQSPPPHPSILPSSNAFSKKPRSIAKPERPHILPRQIQDIDFTPYRTLGFWVRSEEESPAPTVVKIELNRADNSELAFVKIPLS